MNHQLKVLIVEDEAIFALDMKIMLTSRGFNVRQANNGDDTLLWIEREMTDVVLMDIHLKGDMNGVHAASLIRTRFDLPVIYVTAHANRETRERARMTGPSGYLVKPVERETIEGAIASALHDYGIGRLELVPPSGDDLTVDAATISHRSTAAA
jgi:CheY-like chemotaxis protein